VLPDVDHAITRTVTAAVWFGIPTGYLILARTYPHPSQALKPLAGARAWLPSAPGDGLGVPAWLTKSFE
jgi:hypothetical protein